MTLRVIGAGTGRTGTMSLKAALEQLLGEPCYHMFELFARPDDIKFWHAAAFGNEPDWRTALEGYGAGVDWPVAPFWRELSQAFPEALILLSKRPADEWWESARRTIYAPRKREPGLWTETMDELSRTRFPIHPIIEDKAASMALYEAWNNSVLRDAPADRLVVWEVGNGWEPLCKALGVPVPAEPFPHSNTRKEFIERWVEND